MCVKGQLVDPVKQRNLEGTSEPKAHGLLAGMGVSPPGFAAGGDVRRMMASPRRGADRGLCTCIYLNPELAASSCKLRQPYCLEVSVFPSVKWDCQWTSSPWAVVYMFTQMVM